MKNKVYPISSPNQDGHAQHEGERTFLQTCRANIRLLGKGDKIIAGMVLTLLLISLLAVFSAGFSQEPLGLLLKQFLAMLMGGFFICILRLLPLNWFSNVGLTNFLLVAITLLIAYASKYGQQGGGAQSWIVVSGATFQPSEFFKIILVLVLSRIIANFERTYLKVREKGNFWRFSFPLLLMILASIIIARQPDLGMSIMILGVAWSLFMVFQLSLRDNLLTIISVFIIYGGMYYFTSLYSEQLINTKIHFLERLGTFPNPFKYPYQAGYQVIQSYKAIANGGLLGQGLGNGVIKADLPAAHTDFILSVIGEETGLVGMVVVIALIFGMSFQFLRLAGGMNKRFHRIAVTGFAILLVIQSFINIGGACGMIPLTGVTLPFISYGGSSILTNLLIIGIVQKFVAEEWRFRHRARLANASIMSGGGMDDL